MNGAVWIQPAIHQRLDALFVEEGARPAFLRTHTIGGMCVIEDPAFRVPSRELRPEMRSGRLVEAVRILIEDDRCRIARAQEAVASNTAKPFQLHFREIISATTGVANALVGRSRTRAARLLRRHLKLQRLPHARRLLLRHDERKSLRAGCRDQDPFEKERVVRRQIRERGWQNPALNSEFFAHGGRNDDSGSRTGLQRRIKEAEPRVRPERLDHRRGGTHDLLSGDVTARQVDDAALAVDLEVTGERVSRAGENDARLLERFVKALRGKKRDLDVRPKALADKRGEVTGFHRRLEPYAHLHRVRR